VRVILVDVGVSEGYTEVDVDEEGDNEDDGIEEIVHEPDEFDVSSWDESVGDSFNEEELVDVSIHNEDDQDDSWEGNDDV